MATRHTLPYYAAPELLPEPLPTVAQILASKRRISYQHQTPVFRVGEHYAVKYAAKTSTQEGESMLFVRESTSIPVPQVYAIFEAEVQGHKVPFIVMEYIPGRNLRNAWGTLDASEKRNVVSQLRRHLDELRSIPSPGYYGGIWRQPVRDFDFMSRETGFAHSEPEIAGPHETEEQFVDAMLRCYQKLQEAWPYQDFGPVWTAHHLAYLRRQYHAIFKGHPSVFAHANFFPGNVMLRPDGSVVIIDWEAAGWYPSFWEYCHTMTLLDHDNDWDEWVYEVFDRYDAELGWFSLHRGNIMKH